MMIGKVLNNTYQLERELSAGGMGQVFVGTHLRIPGRRFAIKKLHPELAVSEMFRSRFQSEAEAMMNLEHPHIVRLEDFLVEDHTYYLVMEFVDGVSLEGYLLQSGGASFDRIYRWTLQILDALAFCHAKGFVHRDLKPANLLLTQDELLKVTDFGIVRQEEVKERLTATGMVLGTPEYMSPEQIVGAHLDNRSDIYSLGVILYEMLQRSLPFPRNPETQGHYTILYAHMNNEPPTLVDPGIPPFLVEAAMRCLRKRPDERFQTVQEMSQFLQDRLAASGESLESLGRRKRQAPALLGGSSRSQQNDETGVFHREAQVPVGKPIPSGAMVDDGAELQATVPKSASDSTRSGRQVAARAVEKPSTKRGLGALLVAIVLVGLGAVGIWFWRANQADVGSHIPVVERLPPRPSREWKEPSQPRMEPRQVEPQRQEPINPKPREVVPVPRAAKTPPLQEPPKRTSDTRQAPLPRSVPKTIGMTWPNKVSKPCLIWLRSCLVSCVDARLKRGLSSRRGEAVATCHGRCWEIRLKGPHSILCKAR